VNLCELVRNSVCNICARRGSAVRACILLPSVRRFAIRNGDLLT